MLFFLGQELILVKKRAGLEPSIQRQGQKRPPRGVAVARGKRTISVLFVPWLEEFVHLRYLSDTGRVEKHLWPRKNQGLRQTGKQRTTLTKQTLVKNSALARRKRGFTTNGAAGVRLSD